jgi:hypothetical protein
VQWIESRAALADDRQDRTKGLAVGLVEHDFAAETSGPIRLDSRYGPADVCQNEVPV